MGVVISEASELGRELWKWDHTTRETHPADEDKPESQRLHGLRPATPQEYPRMLYKARLHPNGKQSVGEVPPDPMFAMSPAQFERECLAVEGFNRSCQRLVGNDDELAKAKREGWKLTQTEALEHAEGLQRDIANAAAEAAYSAKRMTEKARAEFEDAEAQTDKHVVDVAPKRKRGRPAKGVRAVTGA